MADHGKDDDKDDELEAMQDAAEPSPILDFLADLIDRVRQAFHRLRRDH